MKYKDQSETCLTSVLSWLSVQIYLNAPGKGVLIFVINHPAARPDAGV